MYINLFFNNYKAYGYFNTHGFVLKKFVMVKILIHLFQRLIAHNYDAPVKAENCCTPPTT